jgi:hypothetical protein
VAEDGGLGESLSTGTRPRAKQPVTVKSRSCHALATCPQRGRTYAASMKYGRLMAVPAALLGIGTMWYAMQTTGEDVFAPPHKLHVAHWLETILWVDPRFMFTGGAIVFTVGALWLVMTRRSIWDFVISAILILTSVLGFVFIWAGFRNLNLTRSWPQ